MAHAVLSLVHQIESLCDAVEAKIAESQGPKNIQLTGIEWELWDRHSKAEAYRSEVLRDAGLMLDHLKKVSGYERLKTGMHVQVHYRRKGSDALTQYVDGMKGVVVSMDEYGCPWVQFSPTDWTKAIEKSKSANNISPFESERYEHVNPRKRAVRLTPLDIREYKAMLHKHGLDIGVQFVQVPGLKQAYLYDPLVTDLLGVSKQQLLYVLRNFKEVMPELQEDLRDDDTDISDKSDDDYAPLPHDASVMVIAKMTLPDAAHPPMWLVNDKDKKKNTRLAIWRKLFKDEKKVKAIKKLKAFMQWGVAISMYYNACLAAGVMPTSKWDAKKVKEWKAKQKAKLQAMKDAKKKSSKKSKK